MARAHCGGHEQRHLPGPVLSPLLLAAPAAHPAQGFVWGAIVIGVIGAALLAVSFTGGGRQVSAA
ncbi:hypothetical protein [Deinococcus frigens]|uniref:hypothetical protein n=1 Tax=Deinococcus frigens TaxID=249403 RepID=UPI001FE0297D|nr:hypothetical protein [Deinococcus frigens]